jgi:hypothetical protein
MSLWTLFPAVATAGLPNGRCNGHHYRPDSSASKPHTIEMSKCCSVSWFSYPSYYRCRTLRWQQLFEWSPRGSRESGVSREASQLTGLWFSRETSFNITGIFCDWGREFVRARGKSSATQYLGWYGWESRRKYLVECSDWWSTRREGVRKLGEMNQTDSFWRELEKREKGRERSNKCCLYTSLRKGASSTFAHHRMDMPC